MRRAVFHHLGARSRRVRVGPGTGFDNAVVSLGRGRVLIVTVDPISVVPGFGSRLSAWLGVHLVASDYTASGSDPEFATFTYNFPQSMQSSDREKFIRGIGSECKKLGISVIGGNTGSYPGASFTVVGTGSMLGTAAESGYVTPAMAQVGDRVLMTKHAAIEATGSLANSFPALMEDKLGRTVAGRAKRVIHACSTVEDARTARRVGVGKDALTSMHDATEGGVLGALWEMASASHHAFEVDPSRIPVPGVVAKVCQVFGLDPLRTMGEGSLLLTCNPRRAEELSRRMARAGSPAAEIGVVKEGTGLWLSSGRGRQKFEPGPDGYWEAYSAASGPMSGVRPEVGNPNHLI